MTLAKFFEEVLTLIFESELVFDFFLAACGLFPFIYIWRFFHYLYADDECSKAHRARAAGLKPSAVFKEVKKHD